MIWAQWKYRSWCFARRQSAVFFLLAAGKKAGDDRHAGEEGMMIEFDWSTSVLPLKKRDQVKDHWLQVRLDTVLPAIMHKHQIDMWVILGREYHEDPIMETLLPAAIDSARRLTIIVFSLNPDKTVERYVIQSNPSFEPFYERVWQPAKEDQWECLTRIVEDKNPGRIGVNVSPHYFL